MRRCAVRAAAADRKLGQFAGLMGLVLKYVARTAKKGSKQLAAPAQKTISTYRLYFQPDASCSFPLSIPRAVREYLGRTCLHGYVRSISP